MPPDEPANPLDKTPDMANLTPAERARIYKERAAAAGLGRAPAPGGGETPPPAPKAPPAQQPATPPAASSGAGAGGGEPPRPPAPPAGGGAAGGDPLGKTPDMANLTPAERARIYKERAAAAGIGRPPAAAGDGPAAPAQPAQPAAPAAPAARPAAAAAGGGGAGALTPEQRQRLAAAVQRGAGGGGGAATAAPAAAPARAAAATTPSPTEARSQALVYVWPHLVTIEFMASVMTLLSMIFISLVIQAPLAGHANADRTPNPAKAPWYFLNLQELLLHMHPALAGVLVPAIALGLIAIIPYFDRDTRDVGKWFGTPKSLPIIWHTTWFTTVVLIAEVLLDEYIGIKPFFRTFLGGALNTLVVTDIIVPLILMLGPVPLLFLLLNRVARPEGTRDVMVALFTGFFIAYIVLTIVGTFFRGQGMHLMWPWDPLMQVIE